MDTILNNNIPDEKKAELAEEVGRVVFERIMSRVIPLLSTTEKEEFQKVLAGTNESGSVVFDYLNSKIPNLEVIVQEEVTSFKETSLNVMSKIG